MRGRFILLLFLSILLPLKAQTIQKSFRVDSVKIREGLSNQIVELVISKLDTIKQEYYKIESLKDFPFQTSSLFILSNVLFDKWQINNIEKHFFKNDTSSNQQANNNEQLYGNLTDEYGIYYFGLYGNNLQNKNLITIEKPGLKKLFGKTSGHDIKGLKEYLLDELVKYKNRPSYELDINLINGFNALGLMQREIISIPVLYKEEYDSLYGIAQIITDDLTHLLKTNKDKIFKEYKESKFDDAISFIEYFRTWYNFFYTDVTNKLIDKGYIKIPFPGNFSYIFIM